MPRILTIGNSLADNATRFIEQIAAAQPGAEIIVGKTNLGGCSLEKHWNLVEQCDQLPAVKPYDFYLTGTERRPMSLRDALTDQKWDYVTLQQVTDNSWRPETYHPFIDKLHALVRELAPQAQPVIHQTWAYRVDSLELKGWGIDQKRMYDGICEAYDSVAKQFGCRQLPCANAFQKARAILKFQPDTRYDYTNPVPLNLPEQGRSLITGYHWRTGNTPTGKAELGLDARHGNACGCYLAGAVWFEMFTGMSVVGNAFCPEGVTLEQLQLLQTVAHETVQECGGPLKR